MITLGKNEPESRYEAHLDGILAGFVDYYLQNGQIVMTHTRVLPEFGGKGIGTAVVEYAVMDAQSQGLEIMPECPFVEKFLAS